MSVLRLAGEGFNGFVGYFNKKRRGLVNKYISVYGENDPAWGSASVVIDYFLNESDRKSNFVSIGSKTNAYILFEFKLSPILLRSYTFRTRTIGTDEAHAKSWIAEGSVDGKEYEQLDNVTNTTELQKNWNFHTFYCKKEMIVKYLRFNLTEKTFYDKYRFHLTRVDFFGEMYGFSKCTIKCKKSLNMMTYIVLIVMLIK